MHELRDEIAWRARRGEDIDVIDEELIAPAPLREDEKASLWLYARYCLDPAARDSSRGPQARCRRPRARRRRDLPPRPRREQRTRLRAGHATTKPTRRIDG
jgi:hypothetical protein